MTEYERQSIDIARQALDYGAKSLDYSAKSLDISQQVMEISRHTLWVYACADIIALVALVAAVIGGFIAARNLRSVRWNALLSFEQDMSHRRANFQEIARRIDGSQAGSADTELLRATFNEAKENYFNSLDRLASSILSGHFPDKEMKQDYMEVFTLVIRAYQDDFGAGTHYRKAVKLYNKWQE
jgi:hypothetical protein